MSASPPKPHATVWLLSLLAIPVLYVATWPPIDISNTKLIYNGTWGFAVILDRPTWVTKLYSPLHELSNLNPRRNPIAWYWYWWLERLA